MVQVKALTNPLPLHLPGFLSGSTSWNFSGLDDYISDIQLGSFSAHKFGVYFSLRSTSPQEAVCDGDGAVR
jgi:hypothetical protein